MRRHIWRNTHDAGVDVSRVFEGFADGEDAAVHHVGRGDDLRACVGVAQGLFYQNFDGFVVEDVAVCIGQPVLPVDGVGVEGDVGLMPSSGNFSRRVRTTVGTSPSGL